MVTFKEVRDDDNIVIAHDVFIGNNATPMGFIENRDGEICLVTNDHNRWFDVISIADMKVITQFMIEHDDNKVDPLKVLNQPTTVIEFTRSTAFKTTNRKFLEMEVVGGKFIYNDKQIEAKCVRMTDMDVVKYRKCFTINKDGSGSFKGDINFIIRVSDTILTIY